MCFSLVFSSCISNMWECWNVFLINKKGLSRKEDYSSLNDTSSCMLSIAKINQSSVSSTTFNSAHQKLDNWKPKNICEDNVSIERNASRCIWLL